LVDHINKAKELESAGNLDEAIEEYKKAFQVNPKNYFIQIEIGNLLAMQNKLEEACGYFRRSHRYFPDNEGIKEGLVFCLHAIGNEYQSYKKFDLAVAAFEEAIAYQPQNADLLYNCGNAFYAMNDYKKALPLYQKAISLQKSADTHNNLGNTYRQLGQFNKAKEHYILAIDANPDKMIHTKVELAHLKQSLCDWDGLNELQEAIKNALDIKGTRISPFTALSMTNMNPQDLLQVSSNWCENYQLPSFERKKTTNQKITIGYLSSDFRLHPLYFLIYDVLKYHDLKTFDIKLFYSGQRENTNEQKSYQGLGYPFIEIKNLSDIELAKKINDEGVDILVDLSGFTQSSRSMISALKPAQIHINWLGFAGSLGSRKQNSLCQYLLADQFIIPKDHQKYYSEEVIYLPHCYQPNIADRGQLNKVLKKDYGFQDDHIILASFGQTIKITPERYTSWLTILKQFDNAYLWLLDCNEEAKENLWRVAANHQLDSNRIKFAPKVSFDEHINRHQIIDIFLDTFPYNAHTSASDALWAGIPIVTQSGSTFPSRVAGSILKSIGLEDLITFNEEDYVEKIINLMGDKKQLKLIKDKIHQTKKTSNLFKPKLFTKHLETIYKKLLSS